MRLIGGVLMGIGCIVGLSSCDGSEPSPDPVKEPLNLKALAPSYFGAFEEPANNLADNEGVELGRLLFYDKIMSGDNSVACATCHQQDKAFTDGLAMSEGIGGKHVDKNAMSLSNLLWVNKLFWDGRAGSLEEQALIPIENPNEMGQDLEELVAELQATTLYPPKFEAAFGSSTVTQKGIAKALAQFQRTLISANSKYDQYLKGEATLTSEEKMGMDLFFTHPVPQIGLRGGNCGDCHTGPLTAGDRNGWAGFHNNGLDTDDALAIGLQVVTGSEDDKGKFRAPSLRNIALTAPYMHDGRFETLEEVLDHYNQHIQRSTTLDPLIIEASNEIPLPNSPIQLYLTEEEKAAIIAFLNTLTDQDFIENDDFSDPFL